MGVTVAATAARFAEIKNHTHSSAAVFGYCLMVGNLGSITGNLLGSKFVRRLGTRRTSQTVVFGVASSQIAYGFLNQIWQIPIVAFVAGLTYAIMNIACNSQGSMIQERMGRSVFPSFHGAWSIGAASASLVAGLLAKHVSVEWHLLGNSLIGLFGCIAVSRALLPREIDRQDVELNAEVKHDERLPAPINKYLWWVSIGSLLAIISEVSVGDWSSIYLKDDLQIPVGLNTLGYTCFVLAQISGRFTVGKLIDKHGIPKVIKIGGLLGGFGYLAGILFANTLRTSHHYLALIVICIAYFILGIGVSPMPPSYASVAGSIPGVPTARALMRLGLISSVGFLIGRFIISSLAGLFGLPIALLFPACALIGSGLLANRLNTSHLK